MSHFRHWNRRRARRTDGGIALLITLLVLGIVALLGCALAAGARLSLNRAMNARDAMRRECGAQSALSYAAAMLEADAKAGASDALDETWASDLKVDIDGTRYEVTISDENRKLNVNVAALAPADPARDADLRIPLKRLIRNLKGSDDDFDAIRGWIDPKSAGIHDDKAPKAPIPLIACLRDIPGLSLELFETEKDKPSLEDALCAQPARINVNTATKAVLTALWDDESAVEALMQRRERTPFSTRDEMMTYLRGLPRSAGWADTISALDVQSDYFTVRVSATDPGAYEDLLALVRRQEKTVAIMAVQTVPKEALH